MDKLTRSDDVDVSLLTSLASYVTVVEVIDVVVVVVLGRMLCLVR